MASEATIHKSGLARRLYQETAEVCTHKLLAKLKFPEKSHSVNWGKIRRKLHKIGMDVKDLGFVYNQNLRSLFLLEHMWSYIDEIFQGHHMRASLEKLKETYEDEVYNFDIQKFYDEVGLMFLNHKARLVEYVANNYKRMKNAFSNKSTKEHLAEVQKAIVDAKRAIKKHMSPEALNKLGYGVANSLSRDSNGMAVSLN